VNFGCISCAEKIKLILQLKVLGQIHLFTILSDTKGDSKKRKHIMSNFLFQIIVRALKWIIYIFANLYWDINMIFWSQVARYGHRWVRHCFEFLSTPVKIVWIDIIVSRVVKGMIPDRISYPHPHYFPIFCLNLRKKGIENPRKNHPFYKSDCESHYVTQMQTLNFELGDF
jgi:hypothetical protein